MYIFRIGCSISFLTPMVKSWPTKQGSCSASESSPSREVAPIESIIEDMQSRIKRLERWHTVNTVISKPHLTVHPQFFGLGSLNSSFSCNARWIHLRQLWHFPVYETWHWLWQVLWTFLMSALIGYSLYQRKRQWTFSSHGVFQTDFLEYFILFLEVNISCSSFTRSV